MTPEELEQEQKEMKKRWKARGYKKQHGGLPAGAEKYATILEYVQAKLGEK